MRIPMSESEKGIVTKHYYDKGFRFRSLETTVDYVIDHYKKLWHLEMTYSEFKQKYPYSTRSNKIRFSEDTKEYKKHYKYL